MPDPTPARPPASLTRRELLWGVPMTAAAGVAGGDALHRSHHVRVPLISSTVALADDGTRVVVPPGRTWTEPGSRVLRSASQRSRLEREEDAWLALGGVDPLIPWQHRQDVHSALADLRVHTLANGAAVAGWSRRWRYVWPRDSAFVVAALSAYGHRQDAARVLGFLEAVQGANGTFQARYLPDGSGRTPDRRGVQLDGCGWALWALLQWALPALDGAARELRRFAGLLDRSGSACLGLTRDGTALPPASPDYWEVPETEVTLAGAALMRVGLEAASRLHAMLGDAARADRLGTAAERYDLVLRRAFAHDGYPRHVGGRRHDASVCFLLPPFVAAVDPSARSAWDSARRALLRPAGGLAPGAGWKRDGISWTPETSLFALTAASIGAQAEAVQNLNWLLAHRTEAGSLPEKVLSNGRPAAVAPLSWTTANVLLTWEALAHDRP